MEDQILSLGVTNISACLLGSAQKQKSQVVDEIFNYGYNLVYMTPEFCTGENGRDLLKKMADKLTIRLIAIDEAHCISFWGHDFRHQYRDLGILHELIPDVPILAVTATATPVVRQDLIQILQLK